MFRYVVHNSFFATPSRTRYNAILEDLFFKVECRKSILAYTDWLSPKKNYGLSIIIPIILSLYRSPMINSQNWFIATNFDLNDDVSILVWFLRKPIDWRIVKEDNKSSPWVPSHHIDIMIWFNRIPHGHTNSPLLIWIGW